MKPTSIFPSPALATLISLIVAHTVSAVDPPLRDMKLWLRADTGVTTNFDGTVMAWADQAPGVKHDGNAQGEGIPRLNLNSSFPSGPQLAIRFDGTTALVLSNRDDLQIPTISVYVVASVDNSIASGTFIADRRGGDQFGFALGISDTVAGRARWYTGAPGDNMSPATADLVNGTPYLIVGTFTGNTKKMYVGGTQVGAATGKSLNFATWSVLAVGAEGVYPHGEGDIETGEPAILSRFLAGEIAEILVYSTVSDAQRLAVEAYVYQKYFTKPSGAVAIAKDPLSQTVNELGAVTFNVNADGAPPLSYQWFKDGQGLPNGNAPFFTINNVSRTDAGSYSVKVSNASGSVTSSEAVLTVIPDTTPPVMLSADRDFLDSTQVVIVFSKPVSSSTATIAANYAIDNGITVSKAAMGTTPDTVVLTTSPVTYGPAYSVTVNAVQDIVGNVIAANSKRRVTVADPNAPVPTANLKLWLRADVDVKANQDGLVTGWTDRQVGNPAKNGTPMGTPMLAQAEYFPNGSHPVITFDGASGFNLANVADMRMTNMSFYVVTSVSALNRSRVMIGNYRDVAGWCIGISDNTDGRVKWFTAPPNSMEPEGGQLAEFSPVLLTATYTSVGGLKKLYVNRALAGSATGVNLSYANDTQLTVGYLQGNRQYLVGDIAEILVYSAVSDSQRSLVEAYLTRKFFGSGTGPVTVVLQPASQTVNELQPVTFETSFEGASPVTVQWYRNGTPISGATNLVYTIPSVTRADNLAQFSARLQNAFGSAVTSNAILTVIADTTAPTLVLAKRAFLNDRQVIILFSEMLAANAATQANNYSINGGITVSQALMGSSSNMVLLTTSQIPAGQALTLTVNGVQDLVGNAVAPNTQIRLWAPSSDIRPPTAGLMCWIAADSGVSPAEDLTVTGWTDLAGGDYPHDLLYTVGAPLWMVADIFPSGPNPVIYFNGSSGIQLANPETMAAPDIAMYVVGSAEVINQSRIFMDVYRDTVGYGLGISDFTPGVVKWFTAPPNSMEPETAMLVPNVPVMLTGTFEASGDKKLYLGTNVVGSATGVDPIEYGDAMELTVGYLQGERQFLVGTIAEVLVYSAVSDTQRSAVQNYLIQKYFTPVQGAESKLSIHQSQGLVSVSWTGGGVLQSATTITGPWSEVGAASPLTITPSENCRFYRVKQ